MMPRLCQHARASANGPNASWRTPLPRMPPNATPSKATPCCGTSLASMPSRVPSQNTRQPRATSFAATASPGKMWPPVPPVVIITVPFTNEPPRLRLSPLRCPPRQSAVARPWTARRRSYREPAQQPAILIIDAQQQRDRRAVGDDARAAERQERQREAFRRQHAHVDADVDHGLHAKPDADALRRERGERPRKARRLP